MLGLSGAALVGPAGQAAPYITVCNQRYSDDNIKAYNDSVLKEYNINQGSCASVDNYGGNARVDVDPAGGEADIDSYKHKRNSESYGVVLSTARTVPAIRTTARPPRTGLTHQQLRLLASPCTLSPCIVGSRYG